VDFDWDRANKEGSANAQRAWWGVIGDELVKAHRAGKPVPEDVHYHLIQVLADLCRGVVPPAIENVRAEGAPTPGAFELSDIGWGMAYLRACDDGWIADRNPVKTVAAAFDVNKRTVRGWKRSIEPAKFAHMLPPEIVKGLTEADMAAVLKHQMEEAGSRYRAAGRSRTAVLRRARRAEKN
jgi:hypothetical protein